jgi:hypothetical protein
MGLISKIWKKTGLSKIVSYAAKRAKKTLMSFGKFMNKIGIVGQIAMMFILPGVGNALMSGLSGAFGTIVGQTAAQAAVAGAAATTAVATAAAGGVAATAAQTALAATIASGGAAGAAAVAGSGLLGAAGSGIGATLMRGAGHVLQAASNFVKVGSSAFKTVTDGVSSFIGEFGKTALNKIPGINIQSAAADFSGAWGRIQDNVMSNATKTLTNWNKAIGYVSPSSTGFVGAPSSSALTSATSVNATSATKAAVIKPPTAIAAGTVSKTAASTAFGGIAPPVAGGSLLAVPPPPTYMQKLGTAIKGLPAKAGQAALDAIADAPAKFGNYIADAPARYVDQAVSTQIQKEIMGTPEGAKSFVTRISAIEQAPAMQSVEMNARQYEVSNNYNSFAANNQWGNTAQIYHNSMNTPATLTG